MIVCRKDAAHAFPTTNPASTGSIDLEDHPIPIPTVSTKLRHGRHPKSIWTTAASWFSNPPDPPGGYEKQPNPKKILAKRLGELGSRAVKIVVNSPDPARFRRPAEPVSFERFSFQHLPPAMPVSASSDSAVFATAPAAFSTTRAPPSPPQPPSPRLRSGHRLFQRPSRPKQIPGSRDTNCLLRKDNYLFRLNLVLHLWNFTAQSRCKKTGRSER